MKIREIQASQAKSDICKEILDSLPNWFGIPESIADYVAGVQDKPFYAVYDGSDYVGFVSILVHSPYTAEIYVMGILEKHHRKGIGKTLVQICEEYCREHGKEFLTVKTLDEKNPDEYYKRTRLFYEAMGFKAIEIFPLLWDECNPCLMLAKQITPEKKILNDHRTAFPVAVHLFLTRGSQVLLQRRYNTGYEDGNYSVIAGHIDGGEDVYSAMIREAREEGGIEIRKDDLTAIQVMHRKKLLEERIDYFFVCSSWSGEVKIMEPDKCDKMDWFEIDRPPENIVDYVGEALRNYKENVSFSIYGWELP